MENIAFIFARKNSKRLPKNIKNFAGKPLIAWSLTALMKKK